jgi:predicted DNA-binding transcriptional regulator AlpA
MAVSHGDLVVQIAGQTRAMKQHLVGIHEIAAALGVSRQRADQLSRREDFPKPVIELQSQSGDSE